MWTSVGTIRRRRRRIFARKARSEWDLGTLAAVICGSVIGSVLITGLVLGLWPEHAFGIAGDSDPRISSEIAPR
jgi:hypothetical protein|tara:strand:+ start:584 stop:805 length:222 start_codon:yes stop_codon:yes gene_type:complete